MADEKRVYLYDQMGFFTGSTLADPSPLESGVYLYPPFSTEKEPPAAPEGQKARWNGSKWALVPVQIDDAQVAINKLQEFINNNPDVAALLSK